MVLKPERELSHFETLKASTHKDTFGEIRAMISQLRKDRQQSMSGSVIKQAFD